MTRPVDVDERVGQWKQAYDAIRPEFTSDDTRDILATMMTTVAPDGPERSANVAIALSRMVAANDRMAGLAAAMLTATGIKPAGIDIGDDGP